MDLFIYWISSFFIQKKITKKRLVLGAIVSSLLYCLTVLPYCAKYFYNPFFIFIIFAFSVFITFGGNTITNFIRNLLFVTSVSFILGGLISALFYFFNFYKFIGNFAEAYIHNFSLKFLFFSICISYIFLKFVFTYYKKYIIKKQTFYDIEIFLNSNKSHLTALIDTGNSLTEPISKTPVIVVEFNALKKILPMDIINFFKEENSNNISKIYDYIKKSSLEIRLIPFSSIGKEKGMLIGFFADKVLIFSDKTYCINNAIIAICNFNLSEKKDYNALLNPEIFQNNNI